MTQSNKKVFQQYMSLDSFGTGWNGFIELQKRSMSGQGAREIFHCCIEMFPWEFELFSELDLEERQKFLMYFVSNRTLPLDDFRFFISTMEGKHLESYFGCILTKSFNTSFSGRYINIFSM
ncbi:hypothetical protein CEXT_22071 [Caerostris extrusa]|uniref:Uncharacterized protein n=1 Tax=Caerostris extrusa TaxID=172846 RepID=A0AAV4MXL2_CAEEX|nr:hypothetical protein CEXT_22071 [Caerostris extrusa]